jgi:predicted PurR-regulated permease PerM
MLGRNGNFTSFASLGSFFFVVLMLYWGQPVLMPLAMALLLAFILNPVVMVLRRWRVRHALAVTIVVTLAFGLLGGVLVIIGQQFESLVRELPRYEDNIREKVRDLRSVVDNRGLNRVQQTLETIKGELNSPEGGTNLNSVTPTNAVPTKTPPTNAAPPPKSEEPSLFAQMLGPVSNVLATAGLVIVLVIFLLLRRDDTQFSTRFMG